MAKLIVATQNPNKLAEIRQKLDSIEVEGLDPDLFPDELLETGETLEENARQKVEQVYAKTKANCFADDTGLEVEALNNAPGVYSARYAGEEKSDSANIQKLLEELAGKENRKARFRTVISLLWDGEFYEFEGICSGIISEELKGDQGFGYDPVFVPEGYDRSFAEMSMEEKGAISHRGLAVEALIQFIKSKI
ncbi:RdgB/HAM1 family non-canonical purine NTP pyrophosphatase [bacterium]|nr:RdgB/HAM1 family non-canonical purine NTP pyrophosphatase [bacterium]